MGSERRIRIPWRVTATVAIASFACPVLLDLALSDERRSFGYLAADSFYYLTVARNVATHGAFSFDQETITNGFHPLWQLLSSLVYASVDALDLPEHFFLTLVLVLNTLFIGLGLYWVAGAAQERGWLSPVFSLLPVGVLGFLVSPIWFVLGTQGVIAQSPAEDGRPLYGTLWSYVNGMESSLVILLFGGIACLFSRAWMSRGNAQAVGFGLLLALFTLARLDHLPLPLVVIAYLLACARRDRDARRRVLALTGTFAFVLGAYLLINQLAFGEMLPVSGKLKTSFPYPENSNIRNLLRLLRGELGRSWLPLGVREAQMLIPVLGAFGYLLWLLSVRLRHGAVAVFSRTGSDRFDLFLALTAVATLVLGGYNFLFVKTLQQGHWYFPMSTLFLSVVAVRALDRLRILERFRGAVPWSACTLACIGVAVGYFLALHRQPGYHRSFADFYFEEAPRIRAHYGERIPRILSFDDGIVAFATGFPTMSGLGLNLDAEGLKYWSQGRVFELAMARGFDRITSVAYWRFPRGAPPRGSSARASPALRDRLYWYVGPTAFRNASFQVEYRSRSGRFLIVRATPR